MHREGVGQRFQWVALLGCLNINLKLVAIIGVCAIVDDQLRAFPFDLAAEVGHAPFGNNDLDGMLGTIVEIFPCFSTDGQVKIEMWAFLVKSPEPPIPFIICLPMRCVELTLPKRSTSSAVLIEMIPRRRTTSGLFEISCGRKMRRRRKKVILPVI